MGFFPPACVDGMDEMDGVDGVDGVDPAPADKPGKGGGLWAGTGGASKGCPAARRIRRTQARNPEAWRGFNFLTRDFCENQGIWGNLPG